MYSLYPDGLPEFDPGHEYTIGAAERVELRKVELMERQVKALELLAFHLGSIGLTLSGGGRL